MAIRQLGSIQQTMEKIVAIPLLATFTVGSSILILLQIIEFLAPMFPKLAYLHYLIPFIPPFFITRTAKRINQRRAEYDFIKDAEPYIFVAFPKDISIQSLLTVKPDMISDSAAHHFNCNTKDLLKMKALPQEFFNHPGEREKIVNELISDLNTTKNLGKIRNLEVSIKPKGKETTELYLLNSILKIQNNVIKWQATMMKK